MNTPLWLLTDAALIGTIVVSVSQILRLHERRILDNGKRIERIERIEAQYPRAPVCFGNGDVVTPIGQAKNDCPKCAFFTSCYAISQSRVEKVID